LMAVVITTAISAEHRMRFVVLYCTPDDGHNDA
jgi:hypothetical protein